jgi:hypothetical protein
MFIKAPARINMGMAVRRVLFAPEIIFIIIIERDTPLIIKVMDELRRMEIAIGKPNRRKKPIIPKTRILMV